MHLRDVALTRAVIYEYRRWPDILHGVKSEYHDTTRLWHNNEYASSEHALTYLARADKIPHCTEGEAVLQLSVPGHFHRLLDLRIGDERLLVLVRVERLKANLRFEARRSEFNIFRRYDSHG